MGWFTPSRTSHSRPGYARSSAGSSYSSSSRHHGHHSSTSHYKRRPRDGYIAYLYSKLRHLWHDLVKYAKRHPYKVFFMVIMPLVSGGVLTKLARQFGVRLPEMGGAAKGLGGMMGAGGMGNGSGSGGYYGSEGYGRDGGGGGGAMGGLSSIASNIGGLASMAKMAQAFM